MTCENCLSNKMVKLRNLYAQCIVFIPGRDKRLICSPQHSGWHWGDIHPGIQLVKGQGMKLTTHTTPSATVACLYATSCTQLARRRPLVQGRLVIIVFFLFTVIAQLQRLDFAWSA
jgi:hypothetical protein